MPRLCIGCKQCEQACATENGLPYDDKIAAQNVTSAHKYTTVLTKDDKFMRKLCMNCDDPACASVCPVGALQKTALGPVTYDKHKCMGCRYCMAACPFGVPKYEWDKAVPGVRKCIMCAPRVAAGQAHSLRRDLSHRRDQVRRPRRAAERGPQAHPGQSRQLPAAHLRRDRSRRYLGHAACRRSTSTTSATATTSPSAPCRSTPTRCCRAFPTSFRSSESCWAGFTGSPIAARKSPKPKGKDKHSTDDEGGAQ